MLKDPSLVDMMLIIGLLMILTLHVRLYAADNIGQDINVTICQDDNAATEY